MSTPTPLSDAELNVVAEVRCRILDLKLGQEYLEGRNLVRFVRARNGNLSLAEDMIRKNVDWIKNEKIQLILNWEPPAILLEQLPLKVCAVDQFGGPVFITYSGAWEPSKVVGMKDLMIRYNIFLIEKMRRKFADALDHKDYLPQFSIIMDLKGLGWKHYLSSDGMQSCLATLKIFEAHYPDTLRIAVAVNCPTIVTLFWKMARPLISAETRHKIHFLCSQDKKVWGETISKHIPLNAFPEEYGGRLSNDTMLNIDTITLTNEYIPDGMDG